MDKLRVEGFFMGVRDDSYTKKDGVRVERFLADVYVPGLGGFDMPVTAAQYAGLLQQSPNTPMVLPLQLRIENTMREFNGRKFPVRDLTVRTGALEITARKAG